MDQPTHAWVALRAMALLEDEKKSKKLVALLKPNAKKAAIGAWIPDQADAKRGGGKTDNHVLKMAPFGADKGEWFVLKKAKLLSQLGKARRMYDYVDADTSLDAKWWNTSYKGIANPGQHLADRAMALSGGYQAAPLVALAESVSIAKQDRLEFQSLLDRALAVDVNAKPEYRLSNLVMQRRARWLLSRIDELFLTQQPQGDVK